MKSFSHSLFALVGFLCSLSCPSAHANSLLFEYGLNRDGVFSSSGGATAVLPLPGQSAFNFTTGVGTLSFTVSSPGQHYLGLFFDHSIDEAANTYFNEIGSVTGQRAPGQTWELDEPGYATNPGDIFFNAKDRRLDNSNLVPSRDDVSMALAWQFIVQPQEQAELQFLISSTAPLSGFYLQQTDLNNNASLYFSSTLRITRTQIPDPMTTLPLLWFALSGVLVVRHAARRRP